MSEYPVGWGDALWTIAGYYNVPGGIDAIAQANELWSPDWIYAGDRLKLPGVASDALTPWPANSPVPDGLKACKATVSEGFHQSTALPSTCETRMLEAQLDQDRDVERLIGCKVDDNDYAMSTWQVVLVDGQRTSEPFELANFGEGSVVEGPGGCELLATRWDDVPVGMSSSWHLTGRRMRLVDGQLVFASEELRARRLLYSYEPDTPAEDLSHRDAVLREVEPALQGERISRREVPWGAAASDHLGDARTGRLYPKGYVPLRPPMSVTHDVIRTGAWEQVTVQWL